jgi:hypothetical protein
MTTCGKGRPKIGQVLQRPSSLRRRKLPSQEASSGKKGKN